MAFPIIRKPTPFSETQHVRGILFATGMLTSLLWGCASAGLVMAAGGAIGHSARLGDQYFFAVRFAAAVTLLSVTVIRIWRRRHNYSIAHVALWLEERAPELQYALVTSLDPKIGPDSALRPPLESAVQRVNLPGVALRVAIPAYIRVALLVLVVAVLLSRAMPLHPNDAHAATRSPATPAASTGSAIRRLAGWSVHIAPPAYAHSRDRDLSDPSTIGALVGSTITLRGPGSPDGLGAPFAVRGAGHGWEVVFPMPKEPQAIRFTDGSDSRVVALIPHPDEPPTVVLDLPRADTTYRVAPRTIALAAHATDDIGLADGWFECIVSTGQSEGNFKSVTDTIGRMRFTSTLQGTLRATFSIALTPGSQLSIRAIARDGNNVSGPGVGTSDTRTLRVATKEEYDSMAIAAAAPPILDKALMSQRMLVMQTESLVARRAKLDRAHWVSESSRLAQAQESLRQEVDDILNGATGGEGEREDVDAAKGGAGVVTSARERAYFQVAYQAMSDAARSLAIALPDTALPPERRALSSLDSARVMNRLYLRGSPPPIVVNTARVRLAGPPGGATSDTAAPARRTPGARSDSLYSIVLRYIQSPAPQRDSLIILQVAALRVDTTLAAALSDAAASRDSARLRGALARVRRVVAPTPVAKPGLEP